MLENNNKTVIKMKDTFDGLINRLDMGEKSITKLKDMTIETSKTKKQRKKRMKKQKNI